MGRRAKITGAERDQENIRDSDVTGYMCFNDYSADLAFAGGGIYIFPTAAACRSGRPCVKYCGLAEVKLRFRCFTHHPDDVSEAEFAEVPDCVLCFVSQADSDNLRAGAVITAYSDAEECLSDQCGSTPVLAVEARLSGIVPP